MIGKLPHIREARKLTSITMGNNHPLREFSTYEYDSIFISSKYMGSKAISSRLNFIFFK